MQKIKILSVFGTRPEAIKMAPLVKVLSASALVDSLVCITAQHREMLDSVLDVFGIIPNYDLDIMTKNQDLASITTKALNGIMDVLADARPDFVLVHGDTTTTMAASLAAFYAKIPLGHVEAGLRTHEKYAPFPEEINRRIVGVCADIHFAPTQTARDNIRSEGEWGDRIFITGNTEIDAAANLTRKSYNFNEKRLNELDFKGKRIITMTAHRRENHGKPLEDICHAVLRIAQDFKDVHVVYPVHPSPVVQSTAHKILGDQSGILLTNPLDVQDLHNLMARSYLVLTDSGGLQEGAAYHNVPVVVLRNVTERPEGIDAGCLVLGGNEENSVYNAASKLLLDEAAHKAMSEAKNPFGDGLASQRILGNILYFFGKSCQRPDEFEA